MPQQTYGWGPNYKPAPSLSQTGRWNASSSPSGISPQPSTGFWPAAFGIQQTPNGFWSTLGHGLNSLVTGIPGLAGRGIGLLPQFGGTSMTPQTGFSGSPVTPSVGGWTIDANGNLIDTSSSTASTTSPNQTRAGPGPISHDTSIPGLARLFMSDEAKKNQI